MPRQPLFSEVGLRPEWRRRSGAASLAAGVAPWLVARDRLADFSGRVVLLFFGCGPCPDALPRVGPLFCTVEPERDASDLLRGNRVAFAPTFEASNGSLVQIKDTADAFRMYFKNASQWRNVQPATHRSGLPLRSEGAGSCGDAPRADSRRWRRQCLARVGSAHGLMRGSF